MILEGLKRMKAADYRGAVDAFRSAVIESEVNSGRRPISRWG
jgi:hypothetical protein